VGWAKVLKVRQVMKEMAYARPHVGRDVKMVDGRDFDSAGEGVASCNGFA